MPFISASTHNPNSFHKSRKLDVAVHTRTNSGCGGGNDGSWPTAPRVVGLIRPMAMYQGTIVPNFHKRKNRGELLPYTNYLRIDDVSLDVSGSVYFEKDGCSTSYTGDKPFPSSSQSILVRDGSDAKLWNHFYVEAENRLGGNEWIQGAAAKLYGRGHDSLTSLAELHHVVRMFKGLIPKLLNLARDPRGSLSLERLRDAWLEGRYGWRVLVFEILEINQTLNRMSKKVMDRSKERVGSSATWTVDNSYVLEAYVANVAFTDVTSYEGSVRGSVIADFIPANFRFNLLLTGWELITLSFVIDWFLNIGRALEALSFSLQDANYTSCVGWHVTASRDVSASPTWINGYTGTWTHTSSHKMEFRMRQPRPVPILPSINVNLNPFKVVDLVALALQRLT